MSQYAYLGLMLATLFTAGPLSFADDLECVRWNYPGHSRYPYHYDHPRYGERYCEEWRSSNHRRTDTRVTGIFSCAAKDQENSLDVIEVTLKNLTQDPRFRDERLLNAEVDRISGLRDSREKLTAYFNLIGALEKEDTVKFLGSYDGSSDETAFINKVRAILRNKELAPIVVRSVRDRLADIYNQ